MLEDGFVGLSLTQSKFLRQFQSLAKTCWATRYQATFQMLSPKHDGVH